MTDPQIIRSDSPHQVTVSEGSQVAGAKSLDPNGPSVRKTLAGEPPPAAKAETPQPHIPPPVAAKPQAREGQVFERSVAATDGPAQAAPEAKARVRAFLEGKAAKVQKTN